MNPEVKQKWLTALRSGSYQQTKQVLRKGNKFCVLGVLCDLYVKENKGRWEERGLPEQNTDRFNIIDEQDETSTTIPTTSIRTWAQIGDLVFNDENGELPVAKIINLNDNGKSFSFLADEIEKHL